MKMKLYKTEDLLHNTPFHLQPIPRVNLPEGLMAYSTEICNLAFIPKGQDKFTRNGITAYGASYMCKVMSGTPRAYEAMMNIYLGDRDGDLVQVFYTQLEQELTQHDVELLVAKAFTLLGPVYQKKFTRKRMVIEHGVSPCPIGWPPVH